MLASFFLLLPVTGQVQAFYDEEKLYVEVGGLFSAFDFSFNTFVGYNFIQTGKLNIATEGLAIFLGEDSDVNLDYALGLGLHLSYELSPNWDLFSRIGYSTYGLSETNLLGTISSSDQDFYLGAGFRWKNITFSYYYKNVFNNFNGLVGANSNYLHFFGVGYRFKLL